VKVDVRVDQQRTTLPGWLLSFQLDFIGEQSRDNCHRLYVVKT